jgi:hypothetical protein
MSDMADDFRALREHRKETNRSREQVFKDQVIPMLEGLGFTVRTLQDHHFRVNEALDLFPIHSRFHLLPTAQHRKGKRGHYMDAVVICQNLLLNRPASKQA